MQVLPCSLSLDDPGRSESPLPRVAWLVYRHAPAGEALVGVVQAEDHERAVATASHLLPGYGGELYIERQSSAHANQAKLDAWVDRDPSPYAYHQAGHAVIASSLGWQVECVSIKPKMHWRHSRFVPGEVSLGRVLFSPSGLDDRPTVFPPAGVMSDFVIGYLLAGPVAEYRHRPNRTRWEEEPDSVLAERYRLDQAYFGEVVSIEEWRKRTARLVRMYWREIRKLAEKLIKCREMNRTPSEILPPKRQRRR